MSDTRVSGNKVNVPVGNVAPIRKRKSASPYIGDPQLFRRVDKYLDDKADQDVIDKEAMVEDLRTQYKEYGRRNKSAFRNAVFKAFDIVMQASMNNVGHGSDLDLTSDSEDPMDDEIEESELFNNEEMAKNNGAIPYIQVVQKMTNNTRVPETQELINISSSEDEAEADKGRAPKGIPKVDVPMPRINLPLLSKQMTASLPPRETLIIRKRRPFEVPPGIQIFKKPRIDIKNVPKTTFEDFGGSPAIIKIICRMILHMKHPEIYRKLGVTPPRGFLLHGPPGSGKTLLAHAIAGELKLPMIKVAAPELVAGVSGESELRIRDLFEKAKSQNPCVLFIDEVDSITRRRDTAQKDMERRIVSQLLSSLDELSDKAEYDRVLVIGATNQPDSLDPALRRSGRFDREVCLGIPDKEAREGILRVLTAPLRLAPDVSLPTIASLSPGYVGADLKALTSEAAIAAANRKILCSRSFKRVLPLTLSGRREKRPPEQTHSSAQPRVIDVKDREKQDKEKESKPESNNKPEPESSTSESVRSPKVADSEDSKSSETKDKPEEESEKKETKEGENDVMEVDHVEAEEAEEKDKGNEEQPIETSEKEVDKEEPTVVETPSPIDPGKEAESPPKGESKNDVIILVDNNDQLNSCSPLSVLHNNSPLTEKELEELFIEEADFLEALKVVQPSAKREGFATVPDVTWDDIGSLKAVRDQLQLSIMMPVKYPEKFKKLAISSPTGILLCGPPGCGKTLLAKAVANEANINFISVKGPELLNMYVGESERAVRQCFQRARNSHPCVIFFDELDALCPKRSDTMEGSASSRVVNQLLTEMDGVEGRSGVFLMAATNRPDMVDPAVMRPGRFDKILYVGLPGPDDRADILNAITKNGTSPPLAGDVDLEAIGKGEECEGYTGADLSALVKEASVQALSEHIASDETSELLVRREHFTKAFAKIRPSVSKKDHSRYESLRLQYAAPSGK